MGIRSLFTSMMVVCVALAGGCEPLYSSCSGGKPDPTCPGMTAVARPDAGVDAPAGSNPSPAPGANQGGATGSGSDPSGDASAPPSRDPGCQEGFHTCGGTCKDSKSIMTCGVACEPCPEIAGGETTCDGTKCGVHCPPGMQTCLATNKCIAMDAPCNQTCPAGKNPCNGICVDSQSLNACGSACKACPTVAHGTTTCDGTKCNTQCETAYHLCGDECSPDTDSQHCGTACTACPKPSGGQAACVDSKCEASCPSGMIPCAGACIPAEQQCMGTCQPGQKPCGSLCIPVAMCCTNGRAGCDMCQTCNAGTCQNQGPTTKCPGGVCFNGACAPCREGAACGGGVCSTGKYDCSTGSERCVETNKPNGTGCGTGKECSNGTCIVTDKCLAGVLRCEHGTCTNSACNCAGTGFHGATCNVPDCPNDKQDCGSNPNKCVKGVISAQQSCQCINTNTSKCASNESCRSGSCQPNQCEPNTMTCADDKHIQTCSSTGVKTVKECPTGADGYLVYCTADACDKCPTGHAKCAGSAVVICDGSGYKGSQTCSGQCVANKGNASCCGGVGESPCQ